MCQILKCSYYKNYCIDHNQTLQIDRDPQVHTVDCPNMPQTNPRWQTAAILKNWKILISSQPIDRFWQNLARWCVSTLWTPETNKISRFQKSKMAAAAILKISKILDGDGRHLEKSKNLNIFASNWPILTKFGALMRLRPLDPNNQQNFTISKIKDGGGGHLENSKNCNISAMERAILTKFGTVMRLGPADTGSK